jgi:hypothetical protein
MNQDSFFGFYPTVAGAYRINDRFDATVYGIFWTTPSFGTGGGGGLWTEGGAGINVRTFGVKLNSVVSAGVHYEHLGSNPSGNLASASVYKWLGPYVQATLAPGFALRFTAGPDVQSRPASDPTGSFYKLSASYTFGQ